MSLSGTDFSVASPGRYRARRRGIEPVAQARERRNLFPGKCRLEDGSVGWIRPGMTGLGKVDAGRRSLAWIVTRRTVDFLRLHLWW